jgi:hypothetical protein
MPDAAGVHGDVTGVPARDAGCVVLGAGALSRAEEDDGYTGACRTGERDGERECERERGLARKGLGLRAPRERVGELDTGCGCDAVTRTAPMLA